MLSWFRRLFHDRSASNSRPVETPPSQKAPMPPMYFLDVDESGRFFVRCIHATSSVNADSIRKDGLKPIKDVRDNLIAYLGRLFPQEDAISLLGKIETKCHAPQAALARLRLEDEAKGIFILSMLPLGSKFYLKEAASNAVADGGEVFRAVREAANALCNTSVGAPYPDATPIVFIARHYLDGEWPDFTLSGIPNYAVNLGYAVEVGFRDECWGMFGSESEITVTSPYPPDHLEVMSLAEYLRRKKAYVSPAAEQLTNAMAQGANA